MVDDKLERFLKSWIDGELEADQAAEVAAYLKANPSAQEKVADFRKVAAVIRRIARATPIPMPRPDVIRRRALCRAQEERQVIRWLQRLTAAAAVLLVTTLGMLFLSARTEEIVVSSGADPILDVDPEPPEYWDGIRNESYLNPAMILALNDPSWEASYR